VPSTGMKLSETKERFARLREALNLDPPPVDRDRLSSRVNITAPRKPRYTTNQKPRCRFTVAGAGPQVAKYAGRMCRWFHLPPVARRGIFIPMTLLPNVDEGLKLSSKPKPNYDRMIEMKVSFDTDRARALSDTRHWSQPWHWTPGRKSVGREDPARDGTPRRCAAYRQCQPAWIVSNDPG